MGSDDRRSAWALKSYFNQPAGSKICHRDEFITLPAGQLSFENLCWLNFDSESDIQRDFELPVESHFRHENSKPDSNFEKMVIDNFWEL